MDTYAIIVNGDTERGTTSNSRKHAEAVAVFAVKNGARKAEVIHDASGIGVFLVEASPADGACTHDILSDCPHYS